MKKQRSHSSPPIALSRAVYASQHGSVRVYTRRHINGCLFTLPDQQHCPCPKWIYSKARNGRPARRAATTPSFTEACEQAQKILKGFDPEIAAARKITSPALGPTIEEVLTRYFTVLATRKLSPAYLEGLPAYFVRRTLSGLPGTKSAGRRPALNPSLLDFLDRANAAAIDPITRMEQISSNLLDDWAASWRGNDLTCKQWRTIASGFFRWAVGRRYLDRMPMFGERQRIRRGNRCGYFTDEQYARLRESLPFCLPNNTAPSAHYAERLGAFLDLGRWGGMAIADIVRFSPAANLGANCVLTCCSSPRSPSASGRFLPSPAVRPNSLSASRDKESAAMATGGGIASRHSAARPESRSSKPRSARCANRIPIACETRSPSTPSRAAYLWKTWLKCLGMRLSK